MLDNRSILLSLLDFKDGNQGHKIMVLQRKKDGHNISSKTIKTYYIRSHEQFTKQWDEMKTLADCFSARIMINLNPFDLKEVHGAVMLGMVEAFKDGEHKKPYKYYSHYSAVYSKRKYWIVDIDSDKRGEAVDKLGVFMDSMAYGQVEAVFNSKTGIHVLVKPFHEEEWRVINKFEVDDFEIKRSGLTNLYIS